MKSIKINKNKGILFWITGLSGSGKTSNAKLVKNKISRLYGPTVIMSGDDLRKILNLKSYDKDSRLQNGIKFSKLCKFITNQNINVIFAVVGLFDKIRLQNKKNINNYVEIYIKSNIKKIIKKKKKKIYFKNQKNIVGIDIAPEFPKRPHITVENNFKKPMKKLSVEVINKILKIIK